MVTTIEKKYAPHPRRKSVKGATKCDNSIIALLTKETSTGDKYWEVALFMFAFANFATLGAPIIWLLYLIGVI